MSFALDATVVRPPMTGVHYAVKHEALALLQLPKVHWSCLAIDEELRSTANRLDHAAPLVSMGMRRVWRRVLWQQYRLPQVLKRQGVGALLAMAYTAPLRCPVPYVLQVHDTIALRRPELCSQLNARHMRLLMPGSIQKASRIIVSSPSVRDELLELYQLNERHISVIPMGVDPLFLRPVTPAEDKGAPYLLFVGTIEPKKGIETLLDAYAAIAEETGWRLVLAGRTGWKTRHLAARLAGWRGPGQVEHLGYVPRYELPALMAGARALVVPSREEGFGLPVLEAQAVGTVVIHSNHPVLCDTAGGHGLVFPVDDAGGLVDQIRELAGSSNLRGDRQEAGQAWARQHSWEQWAEAALALLQEVAG